MNMQDKIRAILAEILEVKAVEIGDDFGPDSCQSWDSFSNLRIITALEKVLQRKFSWSEISSMTNFAKIIEVVGRQQTGHAS